MINKKNIIGQLLISLFMLLLLNAAGLKSEDNKADHDNMNMEMNEGAEKIGKKADKEKEILYYTCGMHPQTRVTVEEYNNGKIKDPICGMDLIPVYKEDITEKGVVKINNTQRELAGIETFPAKVSILSTEIRTVGHVAYDPKMRTAEEEYLQALKTYQKAKESRFEDATVRASNAVESSANKLKLMGADDAWLKDLKERGKVHNNLIFPEKNMWVYAEVYEYESVPLKKNSKVEIVTSAYPGKVFKGKIKGIEPVYDKKTRTLRVKILVENKENILKPNMYVDVYVRNSMGKNLVIPASAVLDTGRRKVAFVELAENEYQIRNVKIGPMGTANIGGVKRKVYPVLEGINMGEKVVVKGNYLLDSQSQLGGSGDLYGGSLDVDGEDGQKQKHNH